MYIVTTFSTGVVFAEETNFVDELEHALEETIEVIGEESIITEIVDSSELDPSMFIDAGFTDDEEYTIEKPVDEGEIVSENVPVEEMPELTTQKDVDVVTEEYSDENLIEGEAATEDENSEKTEEQEENENTQEPIKEESVQEEEIIDEEVELEGIFNCDGNHYETKVSNLTYYDTYKSSRKSKGKIATKGTVVKVVDTKYSGVWLFSTKYYKLSTGYWVVADNLKSHSCTAGSTKTTYKYSKRSGDNKYHNLVKCVSASKCTKCACVVKKATESTSKQAHSGWYGNGYCGVCNYKYIVNDSWMWKANYMVNEGLYLRTEPYSAASNKGSYLAKGTIITLERKAENSHGNLWYKSTTGGWVYSGNVTKHDHSYSSSTGKCSCGLMFDYEVNSLSSKAYEIKSSSVSARQYPYSSSTVKKTYGANTVFYVNAYSYSDPNGWLLSKGTKWFRTTDGYWIDSSTVKEHSSHSYSSTSVGKCTYSGCSGEYELNVKWIHPLTHNADAYETKSTSKVARVQPYSNTTAKKTYAYRYQIVMVDRYVEKNANGEKWYRTTSGYWIKATDIQAHSHRMSVGTCTSVDCGHVQNMGLKSMSSKVYETTAGNVFVKDKPFDDATTNRTLDKFKSVKINGYTTKLDEKWYRTTDNKYIKACYLKEHTHSYTNGYCSVCGQYAEYTTQSINPKIVETSKAGVTVWDKPYEKSKVIRTIASNGEKIVVTEQATNYYGNIWYRVSSGGWVYSKNVQTPSGTSITTSNKAKVQSYIITVTDNKNNPIADAYITWLGSKYEANDKGNIELVYVTDKTEFTISAPNYDTITKSDYKMSSNRRDSVVMSVSGSFEATNVNMTYVGETTDLLKKSRSINHYHTQGFFNYEYITIDCVMGSTTGIGKYRLVQGSKTVAESTTGKFENLKTTSFDANKSVELQVFDTSGAKRATQKLLLNVFNVTEGGVTNGFTLGPSDLTLSIGDGTPLLSGVELSFDLKQTLNFALDVGDESTKVVFNFSPKKDENGNFKYTSTAAAYKSFYKNLKECKADKWMYFYNKYTEDAADLGKWKGGVKVGGYVEKIHGENVYKGKLFVELKVSLENFHQTLIGPVPVILEIEVEGKATPYGTIALTNFTKVSDIKLGLDLAASIEGSAGVGIKYVASISVYGKATLKVEGILLPNPALNDVYMYGTLGAKAKVLDMEIANLHIFDTPTLYIVQNGDFVLWEDKALLSDIITDESNYVPIDRGYLDNRSGWYNSDSFELLEDTGEEISIVVSDFDFDVLQSSTYTDIRPQVVTADGTIMMVYNDDNEARANIDKSMLVYSIYNPEAKEWSEPVPVCDDTTADYGFAVCSSNEEIYIVWQNAKSLHNSDATLSDISKNTELYVAKYDSAMGSFQNIEQVTSNEKYEFMPRIASVNGKTIIAWYTNDQDNVFGTEGSNTVEYAFKYDEDYAPKQDYLVDDSDMTDDELEEEVLPSDEEEGNEEEEIYPVEWIFETIETRNEAITSLAVGYMLDESYIAYTTDEDRNTATASDQNIWLYDTQTGALDAYTDEASNVEFTSVHGDRAMTWYNQGMIYYALDSESAPQQLYTEATNLGDEYHIISDNVGNMAILFTVNKDESSDAYVMLYDDETMEWGLPITVTNQDKYIENFNGAYSDEMIVSIFNQTEITDEEMNETNNLCSAIIGERHDVSIANASFTDFELVAGAVKPLTVDVKNNGTVRISSFSIIVYNGENIVSEQMVNKILKPGETTNIELDITMPEVIEKTTYDIEIEEMGYDDAYVADNKESITIGRAALKVTAESSPTETENIVVVTVENCGYEASGGMVALFDDQGEVKEVLVENFDPINNGESYVCAIQLSDDCFDGEPGKAFNIGVVANEEQDIDAYNIVTIYVENVNHDNLPDIEVSDVNIVETSNSEEISLMENTAKTITGSVQNESDTDIENAKICVLTYDNRGIYLGMSYLDTVSLAAGEDVSFTAEFESMENVAIIKIVLINSDNLEPLSSAVEIRLLDDLSDDDEGIDESEDYDAIIEEEE